MSGSVEVVVPVQWICEYRSAAWDFLRPRWEWPVVEAPGGGPWCKAEAVMPVVERSAAEIIVLADADAWVETSAVAQAVSAVASGARWAVPHSQVYRLTKSASEAYRNGGAHNRLPLEQPPYVGIEGGGVLVIGRETFLECPLDPRFTGWGQEDHSLALALYTLFGPSWRGSAPLIHQWHPEPQRLDRKRGSAENWSLFRRYCRARATHDDMQALLGEARDALAVHQSAMHAQASLG